MPLETDKKLVEQVASDLATESTPIKTEKKIEAVTKLTANKQPVEETTEVAATKKVNIICIKYEYRSIELISYKFKTLPYTRGG